MRPPGVRAGSERRVPTVEGPVARGEVRLRLHLQLLPKVHEHGHPAARGGLQALLQGGLGNHALQVSLQTLSAGAYVGGFNHLLWVQGPRFTKGYD